MVRMRAEQNNSLKLQKLNNSWKLMGKVAALDDHKEWIMAISSSKVERIDRLVRNGIKRQLGIWGMINMVERAAKKVYQPKNYSEEDMLRGLLLWRLGGGRVAEFAHRSLDLPSLRTLRRNTIISPITASATFPTVLEIQQNTRACVDSIAELLGDKSVVHQIVMFDELKVEERLRWDDKTNMIQGICREHGKAASLEYTSRHEVDLLFNMLEQDKVHFSTNVRCIDVIDLILILSNLQATVGAIGIVSENHQLYGALPVLVSGQCGWESGHEHSKLVQVVLEGSKATNLRTICISSDGESR